MFLLPKHLAKFGSKALAAKLVFANTRGQLRFLQSLTDTPPDNFRLLGVVGIFQDGFIKVAAAEDDSASLSLMKEAGRRYGNSLRALGVTKKFELVN